MSSPSVTMATANSSSPSIGRMTIRSRTMPMIVASARAASTDSVHRSHNGAPGIHLPGTCRTVANEATRNAPRAARAPWAKLRTWVALKMITKPIASSA